ncbi:MAG: tetratricopeptide repeat protein [Desulfobacterales bacterium]|jgi:tetratricopeptide (TPR) repeat protein
MIIYLRSSRGLGIISVLMTVAVLMLSGCGSSPPPQRDPTIDSELARYNRAARQAFSKGRFQQAAGFYRRSLERAYVRDDSAAILDARYNLAVCLLNLQSYEEALEVVRRAKTEMALADHGTSFDFLLLEATLLHRRGNPDAAWEITDQILTDPAQTSSVIRSKTHFLRGLIASEQDNVNQLRASIAALGQPDELRLRANRQELVGHLAMAEQDWPAAIEAFDRTTRLRREALDYRSMVRALVLAGQASEKAGQTREAAIRYLRAGRSVFWQDQLDEAQRWLNHAIQLAIAADEENIIEAARNHLQQIEVRTSTSSNGLDQQGAALE